MSYLSKQYSGPHQKIKDGVICKGCGRIISKQNTKCPFCLTVRKS